MKKFLIILFMVSAIVISGVVFAGVFFEPEIFIQAQLMPYIDININGVQTDFYDANGKKVTPLVVDGTTYLPLRGVSEKAGYEVNWSDYGGGHQQISLYGPCVTRAYFEGAQNRVELTNSIDSWGDYGSFSADGWQLVIESIRHYPSIVEVLN